MKTVLVVDDSLDILQMIGMILEEYGYQAICTTSADQALSLCEDIHFDLVLCDLCLEHDFAPSGASSAVVGLGLIQALSEEYPKLPVIAMSGIVQERSLSQIRRLPVAETLPKPFNSDALKAKLNAVFGPTSPNAIN